jgi:uncharacterized protein
VAKTKKDAGTLNAGDGKHFIRVHSGRMFDYGDIQNADVNINDIATHLSRIPRWLGATRSFYSVAQHSVLVSAVAEREGGMLAGLYGLLHDAHEAYFGDLPTPFKQMIFDRFAIDMNDIADEIDQRIFEFVGMPFPIPEDIAEVVKFADFDVCMIEGQQLVKNFKVHGFGGEGIRPALAITIQSMPPDGAERAFLERIAYFRSKLSGKFRL